MGLAAITKSTKREPPRILVAGTEGIGKSTFGAGAPSPVFLGPEDGTGRLDVARFPRPTTWAEVLEALRSLDASHQFSTLVVDTIDWIEPLVWAHVCALGKQESIEDFGYGKGYTKALDEWRIFLSLLERIRDRGMTIILLGHTHIKTYKNPEGDDFDRYSLKLNEKAGGLLREWCDVVTFAQFEQFVERDDKTKRSRGVDTGARFLYTRRRAAYDAKERYGLPEAIPLSWDAFSAAMEESPVIGLRRDIEARIERFPGLASKIKDGLSRAGDDVGKLSSLNNWITTQAAATKEITTP